MNTQFSARTLKTTQAATPSIPIPPPSGNKFSTTANSASSASAVEKANQSGIIIIGGKSTLPTDVSSQARSTSLATASLPTKNTVPTNLGSQAHSTSLATASAQQTKTSTVYDQPISHPGYQVVTQSDGTQILYGPDGKKIAVVENGDQIVPTSTGYNVVRPDGTIVFEIPAGAPDSPDGGSGYGSRIGNTVFFKPGSVSTETNVQMSSMTGINGATQAKSETTKQVSKVIAATGLNTPTNGSSSNTTNPPTHMPHPTGSVFGSGGFSGSDNSTTTTTASDASATDTSSTAATAAADTTKTAAEGADLVLEDIKLAAPATLIAGPAYTVKFRNQGTQTAGKFLVGIFAGLAEKLTDDAPRATVEVTSLAAGEMHEVTLRLPQSALNMAGADGKPTAFAKVFIGVDVMNSVVETDETNNTAVIDRVALEATAAH